MSWQDELWDYDPRDKPNPELHLVARDEVAEISTTPPALPQATEHQDAINEAIKAISLALRYLRDVPIVEEKLSETLRRLRRAREITDAR